jgi:O-antigen/teichoic acid export membrane protein
MVSALLSVIAVSYYATPYEVITKLTLIPSAVARAFFPAFAEGFALSGMRPLNLLSKGTDLILLIVAPAVLVCTTFAQFGLSAWLGPSFANHSTPVLRWLAVGVLVNATGQLPYTLIQAAHRPELVGKLVVIQLPFFLVLEFVFIKARGLEGAAMAWSARLAIETIAFWIMVVWLLPEAKSIAIRTMRSITVVLCLIVAGIWLPVGITGQVLFTVAAVTFGFVLAWSYLLTKNDKRQISKWAGTLPVWGGAE